MSTFTVLLLCIQACLVQNVFGQCLSGCGLGGLPVGITPAVGTGSPYGGALSLGAGVSRTAACGSALGLGANGGALGSAYGGALSPAAAYGGAFAPGAAYGGTGEGNVVVVGELPVAGNTAVAGSVPIIGVVTFNGVVPAAGAVSIYGQNACGCGSSTYC